MSAAAQRALLCRCFDIWQACSMLFMPCRERGQEVEETERQAVQKEAAKGRRQKEKEKGYSPSL